VPKQTDDSNSITDETTQTEQLHSDDQALHKPTTLTQIKERSTQTRSTFTGRQLTPTKYLDTEESRKPWKKCTDVPSYSGFRIDQMFQNLQPTVRNYNTVVLHIGANDLSRGLPVKTVLNKYQQLTSAIWDINPTADIILSGLLPKASNQFPGALPRTDFLQDLNNLHSIHWIIKKI
jgi:uncharacterized Rmd1/YagE family protein